MDELMTVNQVAEYLQVSRAEIYHYFKRKENPLKYIQISKATRRVRKQDIIEWLARKVINSL